ncbi:hypothetical protein EDC39_101520 [Geothermobacter ehrlichii]|uniref:DAHP synthase ferredoxin-like domain-containing protein n=1 Tax=Geothermobacter ehrlichii TaxID=213224 RepID=A0A5D3WP72_9BACT|nr:hypothetical protein [Geothermobacter ehrlichii]TYP00352.1 hypothetical protein EDC39_101520 [Geothermobacter ehrlichii]
MLIVMKKKVTEEQIRQVKQFLVDQDYDFHQSTGANHIIIGVIGDTAKIDPGQLKCFNGVLEVFKIPKEE